MSKATADEAIKLAALLEVAGIHLPGDRVLVLRDQDTDTYGSMGLLKPEDAKLKQKSGVVVMLGSVVRDGYPDGKPSQAAGVKVGDRVLTNVYDTLDMSIEFAGEPMVKVSAFHGSDIYLYYTPIESVKVETK